MNNRCKSTELIKGRERFVVHCAEGYEAEPLTALVGFVNDAHSAFDRLDAAAVDLRMGRSIDSEPDRACDDRSREARCRTKL